MLCESSPSFRGHCHVHCCEETETGTQGRVLGDMGRGDAPEHDIGDALGHEIGDEET